MSTNNILNSTEAHLNWPVYADVFDNPPVGLHFNIQCHLSAELRSGWYRMVVGFGAVVKAGMVLCGWQVKL